MTVLNPDDGQPSVVVLLSVVVVALRVVIVIAALVIFIVIVKGLGVRIGVIDAGSLLSGARSWCPPASAIAASGIVVVGHLGKRWWVRH